MANNQRNALDVPLAQWAHEEVQEAVQSTNAHLYQEQDQEQQGIQALGRTDLLTMIATIQQQMAQMQRKIQEQQDNIIEVSHHQQEVNQQASQLLTALQQNWQIQPQPAAPQIPIALALQQPIVQPQQQIIHAAPRMDAAKPLAAFSGTNGEDVESWILAMGLYFAANEAMSDNQKAVRLALNLFGIAQRWFHNAVDVPLQSLTLASMEAEFLAAYKIPNRDQMARWHLRNLRQITSVNSYTQVFRQIYYTCVYILPAEAKACFIEGLKQNTGLYIEECSPETLDAAILLAQAFGSTRFGPQLGQNPRGGCTFERFGRNRGG